jgi:PAS domain S-box-containing protein
MEKNNVIKVLAIDDRPDNLTILSAVARDVLPGCTVLTATNGLTGIDLAAAEDPDVILLDIVMPGMDGFEVCRRLKADERLNDIPVVFLTALKTDAASRIKALEAKADGFLTKPLEPAELTAQIRAMAKVKAANRLQRMEKERLEALVAERTRTLRESEERYHRISDLISDYAYAFRVEEGNTLVCEWVTDSFTRITGYTPQEMDERGGWASIIHPDDMPIALARARRLFGGEHDESEFRIICKDGEIRWLRNHGQSVWDETQGRVVRIFGAAEDITAHKQAEEQLALYTEKLDEMVEARTHQLRAAQEQLVRQEKLAVLGQLAGGVGHELRNPLAVINNAVYFLKLIQPEADEKVRQYLDILEHETRNAEKIITDLLDFARVKSVKQEPVSVKDLLARLLERFPAPPAVQVTLDLPGDLPPIYADPRQVEQMLGNLVLNAYQAMDSPEKTGEKLTISAGVQRDMIRISVQDTGIGISPENTGKIFEPLFTTKSKGFGLGLAVSRKLAEANGGRIEVTSEPGTGSVFMLYLPLYRPQNGK